MSTLDLRITQEAVEYLVQQYNLIYEDAPFDSYTTLIKRKKETYEKLEHCLSHYILTGEKKNWRDV